MPPSRDPSDEDDRSTGDDRSGEHERSDDDNRAAPSSRDIPAPPSSGRALATASDIPPRESRDRISEALHRFLASKQENEGQAFVRGCIIFKLYGHKPKAIEPELVDEIVQTAQREALELRWPPWTVGGIPGWVKRLSERNVAAYFKKQKNDKTYLDRSADSREVAWDRNSPETDYGAREHLIVKYIEPLVGPDPYDKETFRLMWEHNIVGHTLRELAAKKGTTPQALADRLYKLRERLRPKVSIMDHEKPRRAFFFFLIFGGLATLVALWFLFHPAQSQPDVKPQPAPSVTAGPAPVPTFNQALPPTPAPPETAAPPTPAQPQPAPQPAPPRPAPRPPAGNGAPNDKGP